MKALTHTLLSAGLIASACTAFAADDMKKDDAMMKKDTMCADMMKNVGMAASQPMMKK